MKTYTLLALAFLLLLGACTPQAKPSNLAVTVFADGSSKQVALDAGSTIQEALTAAGITLSQTDRVAPPTYTVISNNLNIVVTRVTESFETIQVVIPYDRQELHNESLPSGETRLIQSGKNGLREQTIRHVFENGIETGSSIVSDTVLQDAIPEILMIGVQSPFAPLPIPGKLAYLSGGNAWVMVDSTSNRYPLVTSGDLDGRIFSLSSDGKWLLFSRKSTQPPEKETNTLWVVSTASQSPTPVSLGISNVPNFAAWQPGSEYTIAYSTVEPRATSPGWQANNDLHLLTFVNGKPGHKKDVLPTNAGGIYGWWGMSFTWSPDGLGLVYSRPDGVGSVDISGSTTTPILNMTALNTHSDWAWIPGVSWNIDNQGLIVVTHAPSSGLVSPEESPNFDLALVSIANNHSTTLIQNTGMFANPVVSPSTVDNGTTQVAFLQAIFPTQSATSRYLLNVMNTDGTNGRSLFPAQGQSGLQAQTPVWAPSSLETGENYLAVIYNGNLWLIDSISGQSQQITGDGLTSKIDWK